MVFKKKCENVIAFLCSAKCKSKAISCFDDNHIVQKPRLFFERVCGNCGKDISNEPKSKIFSWQTREFCDKLCLGKYSWFVYLNDFYLIFILFGNNNNI